jgi:HSP20 family protein
MANITRRTEGPAWVTPSWQTWEPLRMMRELMGWDPFAEMAPSLAAREMQAFVPTFEVKETKDAYIFKADLPGVREEDLDITVTGTRLTISGKREAEARTENERFYAYERSYGTFTRSFTLPEGVKTEEVDAELKNGVLTIRVAKAPEHQPKKVSLKGIGEKIKGALGVKEEKAKA